MSLWRRRRSPSWTMDLDRHFDEMSRRIDRALDECRRDMQRFEESFFPSSRYGQSQEVINDDRKFSVRLDVSQFHPDELKVNLSGQDLIIEGRQEYRNKNSYTKRSFVRRWRLPEHSDFDAIKSRLSDSGTLSVEVPKLSPSRETHYRTDHRVEPSTRQRETHID